ncbi:hypothetical protein CK203_000906 [Vitis vinifera]|uniref:Endonuclease/exonuclease/phosphatase domain-containing protein n=1 Tax=Vitis vinifera TaxID=29760 RepID=A0A438KPL0_VITVI|nr:hypothetical protein CK203_000906 [Vitis vinifera]
MWRFSEVIDDLDLRDLPLQRGPFTWSGGLNSQSMSRLDRFLVTKDWECHFSGVVQYTLPRPVFDHFPILLDREGEKSRELTLEKVEVRKEAREDFKKWVLLEEVSWRQKSRKVWLREGDRNTGYVHRMTNAHKRRNWLAKIKINGSWFSEEHEIKEGGAIGDEDAAKLEETFNEKKVFSALFELNRDKAPGPDGFSIAF